jgi:hypothetical protein
MKHMMESHDRIKEDVIEITSPINLSPFSINSDLSPYLDSNSLAIPAPIQQSALIQGGGFT